MNVMTRTNGSAVSAMPAVSNDDDLELLEVKDIARLFKVRESWVRSSVRSRSKAPMPHVMVGRYVRFQESAVRAWLESRKVGYPLKRSR